MTLFIKIFSIIFIIIFMADPVWGMLQKSAVDPSTVEDVINSLISAHEADPTAHLGSGESLESHKNSEILDHLALSVVPDKLQTSLYSYLNTFVAPTSYDSFGTNNQDGAGSIGIAITYGQHQSSIAPPVAWLEGRIWPSDGYMADMIFSWNRIDTVVANGLISCGDDYDGMGLSLNATGWRAFYAIAGTTYYSDYITISEDDMHKARFFADSVTGKFIVTLDGVEVFNTDLAAGSDAMTYNWLLWANWVSGNVSGHLGFVLYSISLNVG